MPFVEDFSLFIDVYCISSVRPIPHSRLQYPGHIFARRRGWTWWRLQESNVLKETEFGKHDLIRFGISFGKSFSGCGISVSFICQSCEVAIAEHPSGVIILSALLQRQGTARHWFATHHQTCPPVIADSTWSGHSAKIDI